jgi:hypothetical protein
MEILKRKNEFESNRIKRKKIEKSEIESKTDSESETEDDLLQRLFGH